MTTADVTRLVGDAVKAGQAANEAMNALQETVAVSEPALWTVLYQQGEAIDALTAAVMILNGP